MVSKMTPMANSLALCRHPGTGETVRHRATEDSSPLPPLVVGAEGAEGVWAEGPGATTEGASLGLLPGRLKRGRVTGATLLHASRTPPLQGLVAMAPSPKAPRMSQFVVATCIALRRTGLSLRKIATHRLVKKRDGKHPAQQSVDKCGRQERRVWKRTQMGAVR